MEIWDSYSLLQHKWRESTRQICAKSQIVLYIVTSVLLKLIKNWTNFESFNFSPDFISLKYGIVQSQALCEVIYFAFMKGIIEMSFYCILLYLRINYCDTATRHEYMYYDQTHQLLLTSN